METLSQIRLHNGKEGASRSDFLYSQLADRIIFAGWREDAPAVIAASDLSILPSLEEGVSNALPEALVSNIPEHQEIASDQIAMFATDSPDALVTKLLRLANEPKQ